MIPGIISTSSSLFSLRENDKIGFFCPAFFEQLDYAIKNKNFNHWGAELSRIMHMELTAQVPKLQELHIGRF